MTKRALIHSPLAGTAIAAVLALCATPVAAQEAPVPDPVITTTVVPAPVPSVEAAPAPVLTSDPMVQSVPDTSPLAAEEAAPVVAAPSARKPGARAAVRTQPAAVTTAPAEPNAATEAVAAPAPAIPVETAVGVPLAPVPLAAEPATQAASDAPLSDTAAMGLGLLGLMAVGGAGALALGRRRPAQAVSVDHIERGASFAAPERKAPLAAPVMPVPARNAEVERRPNPSVTYDRAAPAAQSPFAAANSATIPPGPLPTGEAGVTLFERLVRAAPDAANPFTSPKRRAKRARWLLKQHEYSLRRDTNEPFDFRSFRPNADRRVTQVSTPAVQPA